MAVESASVSKQSASGKKRAAKGPHKDGSKPQESVPLSSPAKRNKSPGIRMVGGRIYDSVNGKTCHQCRQKTRDFVAACKIERNNKPCPIMYCHKCLLNRYGEKAEDVAGLGEWSCPKCRGICNCSICMKKRGHQPTGILINTAKATGYSSVSEMLLKGVELLNQGNDVACLVASPKKIPLPKKCGKENNFGGKMNTNLSNPVDKKSNEAKEEHKDKIDDHTSLKIVRSPYKKKSKQDILEGEHHYSKELGPKENGSNGTKQSIKKMKRVRFEEMNNNIKNDEEILKGGIPDDDIKKPKKSRKEGAGPHGGEKKQKIPRKEDGGPHGDEKKQKKSKKGGGGTPCDEKKPKKSRKEKLRNDAPLDRRTSPRKLNVPGVEKQGEKKNVEFGTEKNVNKRMNVAKKGFLGPLENYMRKEDKIDNGDNEIFLKDHDLGFHADIPLPEGEVVNNVAGIDLQAEDVGNAFQFLEFGDVFGKILQVKKGQAAYVLQDIFQGRTGRRGKFSMTVQFHINLLSILLTDQGKECTSLRSSDGKSSWFQMLKDCLSESQSVLKVQRLDSLEKAVDYESLTASEKLRLLNVLCDEVLGTEKMRNWMDAQNAKLSDKVKEARQKILSAKDKEKSLKQKMKDDIAKAIVAKHGAPLSISEHEAIVSRIKREVEQAQAEVLESKGMFAKKTKTLDTVRIEPVFVGSGGHAYWNLKCYKTSALLHQKIGNGDALTLDEKWFAIDDEGKETVEKHICSLRVKRLRAFGQPVPVFTI